MDDKRGLYQKYSVERTDGSSVPGGKHEHCDYFILDLTHDKFAREALEHYADRCADEFPALYDDLNDKFASSRYCLGPKPQRKEDFQKERVQCTNPAVIPMGQSGPWLCVEHAPAYDQEREVGFGKEKFMMRELSTRGHLALERRLAKAKP